MIEKALRFIIGMDEPHFKEHAGQLYADKDMERMRYNPKAEPIQMTTLTSLVDYIKTEIDTYEASGTGSMTGDCSMPYQNMLIHVKSLVEVEMYSPLDAERRRETMVTVKASVPAFDFNRFMEQERFIINVQTKFLTTEGTERGTNDKALLLKFAGTVENGTVAEYGDDGITQKATVRTGIASKTDAVVPNPVRLIPYRTFIEVEQPASAFIFRMNGRGDEITCAVFEADGGAWQNEAMKNIKEYLEEQLKDYPMFKVIS